MASEKLQIFTDGNFDSTVVKSDKPVLVDFWRSGAAPAGASPPLLTRWPPITRVR